MKGDVQALPSPCGEPVSSWMVNTPDILESRVRRLLAPMSAGTLMGRGAVIWFYREDQTSAGVGRGVYVSLWPIVTVVRR